jgi:hypothetical protein
MTNQQIDFPILLQRLKPLVKKVVGDIPSFENTWNSVIGQFVIWLNGLPAPVSDLTRDLALLEELWKTFGIDSLRWDIDIKNLVLSGAIETGSKIKRKNKAGVEITYKVIDRNITTNFGIQYILQTENGDILTEEYFE